MLAGRGIEVTYTEKISDLNPETLGKYDALLIYANTTRISKDQEKALLDYVAGGGGFVPLHCASFCFLNSPEYIALVGAQFQKHGTGEFETTVVDPDHPIIKGLEPFRTWDETYVHTKHNTKDRHVLQTRDDQAGSEPWTWTRTHGKGRVFYTAYGHDARTWGHPGFHDLVERGIRWAANKGDVYDSRPRVAKGLKPFEYEPAEIPLYTPGARWGTLGEPIRRMQKPLSPEESQQAPRPARRVRGEAVRRRAADLQADHDDLGPPRPAVRRRDGRLPQRDAAEGARAATGSRSSRTPTATARPTRSRVFADNLSIPTSLCYANGGLIVAQAPDMLFLKDTDGDGKADERKVLFTGFGTYDTHAGPSNLRYGLDNWIYAIIGYSGFSGEVGGERHQLPPGVLPVQAGRLEAGVPPQHEQQLVGRRHQRGGPPLRLDRQRLPERLHADPEPILRVGPRHGRRRSCRTSPTRTASSRSPRTSARSTGTAGSPPGPAQRSTRPAPIPKHYWNRTAFVAEPTGHLVATFTLHPDGTDFHSHNAWNLVASDDEWTSPILAEVGPDGQVWVIDWYNFIVQHNPTPEGYKTGKGSAYETPLRDKTHGRIYRIVAKDGKPSERPKLSKDDPKGLVAALKNDNMFWRLHAQRLLVERGDRSTSRATSPP